MRMKGGDVAEAIAVIVIGALLAGLLVYLAHAHGVREGQRLACTVPAVREAHRDICEGE